MCKEENPELYVWLEDHWRKDNHAKYQHFFGEWISNITENQILGFTAQMNRAKSGMSYTEVNKNPIKN